MSEDNAEAAAEGENATQQSVPPEPNHSHVPGEVNKENKGEAATEGDETAQKPTSSEPAHSSVGGEVKKENNAEAASKDNNEAAAEGEKPAQQPTFSEPGHPLATGGLKEHNSSEAASGDNGEVAAEGRKPAHRLTSSKPNHPLALGKVKETTAEAASGNSAEAAAGGEKKILPSKPAEPNRSLASGKARRVRKFFHRLFSLVHILVELGLFMATGWLAYATYHLFLATVELGKVTSGLASVTSEEIRTNKSHATSLGKKAQEVNSNLVSLSSKFEGLKSIFPSAQPSKLTIGDNFNCDVSKSDGKLILRKADECFYLKIPLKNSEELDSRTRLWIEFVHAGKSWECPPAERADSGGEMTTNLVSCFAEHQQERRGEIEFIIKTNQQEER